jgi:hypothetical protein
MNRSFILTVLLVLLPLSTQAEDDISEGYFPQQMTARELLQACASSSLTRTGRQRKRYCHGFVSGVEEAIRLFQRKASSTRAFVVCAPDNTSSRQFAEAFMRYAGRKSVDLDKSAAMVTLDALQNAYPCTSQPTKK